MHGNWKIVVIAFWLFLQQTSFSIQAQPADVYAEQFIVKEGLILVRATVDGQAGTFILDTGAPTLVLNNREFDGQQSDWTAQSVNGTVQVQEKMVKKFTWGTITKKHFRAVVSDLSHLEQAIRQPILGLIGYEVIRSQEICLDYENLRILLYKPNHSGMHDYFQPKEVLSFELWDHLPIINAEIGEQHLQFGLDTGAEANLLGANPRAQLVRQNLTQIKAEELRGLDQQVEKTHTTIVKHTSIDENTFVDMKYVFTDLSHLQGDSDGGIDGLLGFPFFSACKISINYRKREIYIWEGYDRCQLSASIIPKKVQKG